MDPITETHISVAITMLSRLNCDLNALEQCGDYRGAYREIFAAQKHILPLQMALRRLARRPTTPTMSQPAQT
jgi:hypothetical protein